LVALALRRKILKEQQLREEDAEESSMIARFRPGDVVVYRKQKSSSHPGPHAQDIQPALHGDSYSYMVEKFWRVVAVQSDNTLVVRTRKGKQHTIAADHPNLRRIHWWERLLFGHRVPPRTVEMSSMEESRQ
jgi:hypothetical protein